MAGEDRKIGERILAPEERERSPFQGNLGLIRRLTSLPKLALRYSDSDALPHLLLHELGHDDMFGLNRAVYVVDNPEFDELLGVAGFNHNECHFHGSNMWEHANEFHHLMRDADFHNTVMDVVRRSVKKHDLDMQQMDEVLDLAKFLGLSEPSILSWNMRNGNHGLLIYDEGRQLSPTDKELLSDGAAILGIGGVPQMRRNRKYPSDLW